MQRAPTGGEGLADLVCLLLISDLERVQVLAQTQLELGELLALLDLNVCKTKVQYPTKFPS